MLFRSLQMLLIVEEGLTQLLITAGQLLLIREVTQCIVDQQLEVEWEPQLLLLEAGLVPCQLAVLREVQVVA